MAKKKAQGRKKEDNPERESYFVGLGDPVELRKNILEPTREVIQFLQSYEEFKKTKEEKTQTIMQLKEDLKEIKAEVNLLRRLLPKPKIKTDRIQQKIKKEIKKEKETGAKPKEEKTEVEKAEAVVRPKRVKPSELESLDKELGEIEKKLGTIN